MSGRLAKVTVTVAVTLLAVVGPGIPVAAATVPADKPSVLSSWTQTGASSYAAWNAARIKRAPWSSYAFNWTTDHCSKSPDNPLGFPFTLPCYRHDFGYRNYKTTGKFSANKRRLDSALYADLKRVCAHYRYASRVACDSLASAYYAAVSTFGGGLSTAQLPGARQAQTG